MKALILIFVVSLMSGCATVHKDRKGNNVSSNEKNSILTVSAEINDTLSSEYFGMIEFVIENNEDKWIEIESIKVDINDDDIEGSMKLTTGNDFNIWSKAISKRNNVENYNKAIAYSAIIGASSIVSSTSNSISARTGAVGMSALALTSLSIEQINSYKNKVEGQDMFPEGHLLNEGVRVPPGLFVDRWLLINTTNHESNDLLTKLFLDVTYRNGGNDRFEIPLFMSARDLGRYRWQNTI